MELEELKKIKDYDILGFRVTFTITTEDVEIERIEKIDQEFPRESIDLLKEEINKQFYFKKGGLFFVTATLYQQPEEYGSHSSYFKFRDWY